MLLTCNAKINLGLSVTGKRPDGFHSIESLFIPIPWNDYIEIKRSEELAFSAEGIHVDGNKEDNLCLRAYHLLNQRFGLPKMSIHLKKEIPIGAGLGGGSSDAAFVLKGLNEFFELNLSIEELEEYAGQLGSDCVFFIRNKAALVTGRGEQIDTTIPMTFFTYCIVVNPEIHISTKEAYSKISPKPPTLKLSKAITLPLEQWQDVIKNDFELALLPDYPALQVLKQKLLDMGAYYVSMSGSGSTFFAFFDCKPDQLLFNKSYKWRGFELKI